MEIPSPEFRRLVQDALEQKLRGNGAGYSRIVQEVGWARAESLAPLLMALGPFAGLLGHSPAVFRELVDNVFGPGMAPWLLLPFEGGSRRGDAGSKGGTPGPDDPSLPAGPPSPTPQQSQQAALSVPHAFYDFTLTLVSVNCCFLPSVLHCIARALVPADHGSAGATAAAAVAAAAAAAVAGTTPKPAPLASPVADGAGDAGAATPVAPASVAVTAAAADAAAAGGSSMGSGGVPRTALAFQLLRQVLRLVPTGVSKLFGVLSEHFPHKRHSSAVHAGYVSALLVIADELPPLQDRVVAIIVEKMILIDVRALCRPPPHALRPAVLRALPCCTWETDVWKCARGCARVCTGERMQWMRAPADVHRRLAHPRARPVAVGPHLPGGDQA